MGEALLIVPVWPLAPPSLVAQGIFPFTFSGKIASVNRLRGKVSRLSVQYTASIHTVQVVAPKHPAYDTELAKSLK
jgi:hypothetical protein